MPALPSLAVERHGAEGDRLALLHGFTQTARCWGRFGALLGEQHELLAVDLPGHGRSSAISTDLEGSADLVAAAVGPSAYLGYSMGGRVALHLALQHPAVVERLILIGATGGLADGAEREARRASDERLATHLEQVGVDAFLDEWLAQPLFAGLDADAAALHERRTNTAAGLASSLHLAGTGTQRPLWSELDAITVPVLVLAGADDVKFAELGVRLVEAIGENASYVAIEGAGHCAHLERPERTARAIEEWWSATRR